MEVNKEKFEEVLNNNDKVLVDFFATWCPPCKALGPIVEDVAKDLTDVKVIKVNVDDEQDLAIKYGIMSVPTLVFFDHAAPKAQSVGLISKQELVDFINSNK